MLLLRILLLRVHPLSADSGLQIMLRYAPRMMTFSAKSFEEGLRLDLTVLDGKHSCDGSMGTEVVTELT